MRTILIEVIFYWDEFSGRPKQWLAEGIKCLHADVQLFLKEIRRNSHGYPILKVELIVNWPGYEDVDDELVMYDAITALVDGVGYCVCDDKRQVIL